MGSPRRSVRSLGLAIVFLGLVVPASGASGGVDSAVTGHAYVRADGGTDATMTACSSNHRQQNEPTVAVDPRDASVVTSGANDYCATPTNGDAWRGYYRSTDGGASWNDSLVPGYPLDASSAGVASPLHGRDAAAGDPVQAWDAHGRVFVGGNAFNRAHPNNGDVWVATYDNPSGPSGATSLDGSRYVGTVIVGKGVAGVGRFNDKTSIEVDRTLGACDGNVYYAWSLFPGNQGSNEISFSRSTDHGASFSKPVKISDGVHDNQFSDIAVAPDGTVFVTWRQFEGRGQANEVVMAVSHDCGASFSRPANVHDITVPFDSFDFSMAAKEGPEDGIPTVDGNAPSGGSRDCGDAPFDCVSGFTYFRFDSFPTVAADANGLYVAWNERVGAGESRVLFTRSTDGGAHWSAPVTVDASAGAVGHQLFPDLAVSAGVLTLVYYDSRHDACFSPDRPMGNDASGDSCGPSLDVYASQSSNGGASWSSRRVSDASHNPNFEMFGNRRVPFHGDYIYVSAVGAKVFAVWTDNRDVVAGSDPRFPTDTDGDDVLQCRTQASDGSWSDDQCPNAGGLDQNVYGDDV